MAGSLVLFACGHAACLLLFCAARWGPQLRHCVGCQSSASFLSCLGTHSCCPRLPRMQSSSKQRSCVTRFARKPISLPLPALPPAADSSVKMVFEPQPQPRIVAALNEKTVTQASTACTAVGAALCCASVPLLGTWGPLQMLNRG